MVDQDLVCRRSDNNDDFRYLYEWYARRNYGQDYTIRSYVHDTSRASKPVELLVHDPMVLDREIMVADEPDERFWKRRSRYDGARKITFRLILRNGGLSGVHRGQFLSKDEWDRIQDGHVLRKTFKIRRFHSRGGRRWVIELFLDAQKQLQVRRVR